MLDQEMVLNFGICGKAESTRAHLFLHMISSLDSTGKPDCRLLDTVSHYNDLPGDQRPRHLEGILQVRSGAHPVFGALGTPPGWLPTPVVGAQTHCLQRPQGFPRRPEPLVLPMLQAGSLQGMLAPSESFVRAVMHLLL